MRPPRRHRGRPARKNKVIMTILNRVYSRANTRGQNKKTKNRTDNKSTINITQAQNTFKIFQVFISDERSFTAVFYYSVAGRGGTERPETRADDGRRAAAIAFFGRGTRYGRRETTWKNNERFPESEFRRRFRAPATCVLNGHNNTPHHRIPPGLYNYNNDGEYIIIKTGRTDRMR